MNIGKMRHRVILQDETLTPNAMGQPRPSWSNVATYSAEVVNLSGRELTNAQQRKDVVSVMVRMRYGPTIKPSQRLLFGSRTFHIHWTDNLDNRSVELQVFCEELVSPQ